MKTLSPTQRDARTGAAYARAFACLLLGPAVCVSLTGCFGFLKPAEPMARHFTLTPVSGPETAAAAGSCIPVGIGQVKLASYLFDKSLAVRKGTNEIVYLPLALWAERLDTGIQRAVAANLATLLPTDQVRLSAWRSEDVAAGIYVSVEQLDVDENGHGVLVAWWRVLSPGGEKVLKNGESRLERQGPPPEREPSGAITTLSEMVADLSRQLTQAVKETAPAARQAAVTSRSP